MSTEERRLAAIVFTDICGFTELMSRDETKAMALLEQQRALLKPIIRNFNGEWLKEIGDGVLIAFPSPVKAVTCSLEIQRILAHNSELTIRIGIHIGDVIQKDGDVFGDAVNIASRLEPLAEPGGICVSERVHEDIENKPDISTSFQEEQLLKGVEKPIKVYSIFTQMGTAPERAEKPAETKTKIKPNYGLFAGIGALFLIALFYFKTSKGKMAGSDYDSKSIAVLPFNNLSNDIDDEYFADGMTEDILTELSKIQDLMVISRTTIMKYKGTTKSLKEIGKELGVGTILEGSVRRVGNRVRITGQLINTANDHHLWAEKFDRDIEDIFAVQDEVATAIANVLRIKLSDEEVMLISSSQTESIEAYDLYIKGRSFSYSYSAPNIYKAINYFNEAIKIDPNYALPYAGIARSKTTLSFTQAHDDTFVKKILKEVELHAEKAIALGPKEAEAQFTMGYYLNRQSDESAYEYLKKAIELNPSHAHAHDEIGDYYLDSHGNLDEALYWFEKALKLDPDLAPAGFLRIYTTLKKGQANNALVLVDDGLKRHPNVPFYSTIKHAALMMAGKYHDAYKFMKTQESLYQTSRVEMLDFYFGLGQSLIMLNKFDELDNILEKLKKIKYYDQTHEYRYLTNLRLYYEGDYRSAINGFNAFDNSEVLVFMNNLRPVLSDICHYWKAKSYLELGEFENTIDELNQFRPNHNGSTLFLIFDEFWPKRNYLKGLAYEGLGDNRSAQESYEKFLKDWSDADDDLLEIMDAKERLRKLKQAS